jgi:phosphate transport system substrate-binding protein
MKKKTTSYRFIRALALISSITLASATHAETPETVTIAGSNTFGEELGPTLIEAFHQEHPHVRVSLTSEGTGAGMIALFNRKTDLAAASRVASEDELRTARSRNIKLRSHFIGSYSVTVVVNEQNPLQGLRDRHVRDIFSGVITNWKDVGGPDAPINVYIRDPVSGTYLGFQEIAMQYRPYVETAERLRSYPAIADAVASDVHGIGYIGLLSRMPQTLRALLINGIPPNAMAVNEGLYPYARGLRFYTIVGRESSAARAFIRFVRGPDGQEILEQQGYAPRAMQRMDSGGISP